MRVLRKWVAGRAPRERREATVYPARYEAWGRACAADPACSQWGLRPFLERNSQRNLVGGFAPSSGRLCAGPGCPRLNVLAANNSDTHTRSVNH
jgi:hypothetical protein